MRTDNMMRIYLGDEYTGDSLINFCRYWIKGIKNYASYYYMVRLLSQRKQRLEAVVK